MSDREPAKPAHLIFYRSDTGRSFGLDERATNRARLRELLASNPRLLVEDDRHRLYHCATAQCFFRLELMDGVVSYYVPYELIQLPFISEAVAAWSWGSLLYGIGTASKDRVFLRELPAIADMVVSQPDLPYEGVRFWLDLQGHALSEGFSIGLCHEGGKLVEHGRDAHVGGRWVDEFQHIEKSKRHALLRFYYASE